MSSRRLLDLHPKLAELCQQHIDLCSASGVRLLVICTYRSEAEQRALYAQGRLPLDVVNAMRAEVALEPITDPENRHAVTRLRTGSKHGHANPDGTACALAYDAIPLDDEGHADWSGAGHRWATVVAAGKRLGLTWGGDWHGLVDRPHWELPRNTEL